jgi:Mrp family chromosome partitioning ATPase/capsular polysaccharide biosynthesis protein
MNETTDASAILTPVWRRKWLILLVGVLVAAGSYAHYKRQPSVYQATTQIYLANGSEEQSLLASAQGKRTLNERAISDQAAIVNSNVVSETVHNLLRAEHDRAALKGKARAKATAGSDLVAITTEARNGNAAAKLANTYASVYINRQHATYLKEVRAAIVTTRRQLRRVEAQANAQRAARAGKGSGAVSGSAALQAATLAGRINQFESDLTVSSVAQISPATQKKAELLSPMPKKNAIFGFVLGLLLASIAAYMLARLDGRLRSLASIEAAFRTSALAALPKVNRPILHEDGQPRVSTPLLEPLRRAHTALQLGSVARGAEHTPRVLLALSADAADGRSTFLAGLALARRDAGERVALVEADFRRPVQAKLLDITAPHGLAEVLEGRIAAGDAMRLVSRPPQPHAGPITGEAVAGGGVSTLVQARSDTGAASVLVCGGPSPNPPALLASAATEELLRALADDHDSVLIDVPSPLQVSDAMSLLRLVDGIVIVARVGHTRQASAERLMELLERSPSAPVLGVVANGVATSELKQLGFSPQDGEKGRLRALLRR